MDYDFNSSTPARRSGGRTGNVALIVGYSSLLVGCLVWAFGSFGVALALFVISLIGGILGVTDAGIDSDGAHGKEQLVSIALMALSLALPLLGLIVRITSTVSELAD